MADRNSQNKSKVPNAISPETGQFDARFLLWRMFCAEHDIAVDTLPSDLEGELRDKWDKVKDDNLHKPTEKR